MKQFLLIISIGLALVGCKDKSEEFYRQNHFLVDWSSPPINRIIDRHLNCLDRESPFWMFGKGEGYSEVKDQLCLENSYSMDEIVTAQNLCQQNPIIRVCDEVRIALAPFSNIELGKYGKIVFGVSNSKVDLLQQLTDPQLIWLLVFIIVYFSAGFSVAQFAENSQSKNIISLALVTMTGIYIHLQLLPILSGSLWFNSLWQYEAWSQIVKLMFISLALMLAGTFAGKKWKLSHPEIQIHRHEILDVPYETRSFLQMLLQLPEKERSEFFKAANSHLLMNAFSKFLTERDKFEEDIEDVEEVTSKPEPTLISRVIPRKDEVDARIGEILGKYGEIQK